MNLKITLAAVSLAAFAAPAVADTFTIQTKSGKVVWDVDTSEGLSGTNNGGKGKTEKAAGGLTNAVGKGGLAIGG